MAEFGTTPEQMGEIAVAQRQWACRNPEATMYGSPITLNDYMHSPMVVEPYRLLDICQQSDGALAFVVTTTERNPKTRSGASTIAMTTVAQFGLVTMAPDQPRSRRWRRMRPR